MTAIFTIICYVKTCEANFRHIAIRGFHGDEHLECYLLDCDTMQSHTSVSEKSAGSLEGILNMKATGSSEIW